MRRPNMEPMGGIEYRQGRERDDEKEKLLIEYAQVAREADLVDADVWNAEENKRRKSELAETGSARVKEEKFAHVEDDLSMMGEKHTKAYQRLDEIGKKLEALGVSPQEIQDFSRKVYPVMKERARDVKEELRQSRLPENGQ